MNTLQRVVLLTGLLAPFFSIPASVEARRDEIFFGENQGQKVINPEQKQLELMERQIEQMELLQATQSSLVTLIDQLKAQMVEQQQLSNRLLEKLASSEQEKIRLLDEIRGLQQEQADAAQEMEKESQALRAIAPSAGPGTIVIPPPGQVVGSSEDGSVIYRTE